MKSKNYHLPEGIEDAQEFINQYNSVKKELRAAQEGEMDILNELRSLEKEAPEESVEELEDEQKEAENNFQNVFRRAECYARIKDLTNSVLEDVDSGTYEGLKIAWRFVYPA